MQVKKLIKHFALAFIIVSSSLCSCRKCLTCTNSCMQVYTYDTTVRLYDTLCSENFPSWQAYIDTVNGPRGGYIKEISASKFSSCDASQDEIKKALCQ